jgi:DNA-binding NarL/FixJ family response regulator
MFRTLEHWSVFGGEKSLAGANDMATPGKPLTDRERRQIVEMKAAGQPSREIARCLAVTKATVNRVVREKSA